MARSQTSLRTFNRGLISPLALARTDLERTALSAETMVNWIPRNLGSMMLRPGTAYIANSASNNRAKYIPFIYSTDDTALIEVTDALVRVLVSDALVTRVSVTTTVNNGTFTSGVSPWVDASQGTASTSGLNNRAVLDGDGTNEAVLYQTVTVASSQQNKEHALAIHVYAGPVTLKVGSSQGADDYVTTTSLDEGYHSLAFTPTGDFTIQFENTRVASAEVNSCVVESAGVMTITAPWATADLDLLRWDQSADVVYVASQKASATIGYAPYKIERRGTTSWSVVKYQPEDGPYRAINTSTITITPSALEGDITLTASQSLFQSTHVGALFKLISNGQTVTVSASAENTFTDPIKVFGATNGRIFTVTISGLTDSTVTLQRNFQSADSTYNDVPGAEYTMDNTFTYDDTLDNQEAWYRIGIKTGNYGTDTVALTLDYPNGNVEGKVRITAYSSATSVTAAVLDNLGGTDATVNWYEGEWSGFRGYPSAVALVEGRLGWFGLAKAWLSVSDAYESFDDAVEGDSGPITRSIGSGPVDNVNWVVAAQRLLFGTDGREHTLRSSTQDEILTPTNCSIRDFGTQGSATVAGIKVDDSVVFVQRGGRRLLQAAYGDTFDYRTSDLSRLYPEGGGSGITHIAAQRQPDTRIHCVRSDGTVTMLINDPAEEVSCWVTMSLGTGFVQDTFTDLNDGDYTGNSLDVSSEISGSGQYKCAEYNADGTQLHMMDTDDDAIRQYSLTTPYDLSTGSYDSVTFSFGFNVIGFNWLDDGSRMLVQATANPQLRMYNATTAYNISTLAVDTGNTTNLTGVSFNNAKDFWINNEGTVLFMLAATGATTNPAIFYFDLATAYDLTSFSEDTGKKYAITEVADSNWCWSIDVDANDNIFVLTKDYPGSAAADVNILQWKMDTTDDPSSSVFVVSFNLGDEDQDPWRVRMFDGSEGWIVTGGTTDTIYQYGTSWATEVAPGVEDVVVLPGADGTGEDAVYYSVARQVGGANKRFLEKWSLESECEGGTTSKNLDAHLAGTVTAGIMTGLDHIEGEQVSVWVNGVDAGTYRVTDGKITGVTTDGSAVAGLAYTAQFKSTKLGQLVQRKKITRLGIIAQNMHYQGLSYGQDFDNLDELPMVENGATQADDTVHSQYDEDTFVVNGYWDTDSRLCLQAASPRPVTLLAAIVETEE